MSLADIVKIDFLANSQEEREQLLKITRNYDVDLLAEKVETKEEFREAKEKEYSYFQGHFFKKPEILEGRDLPTYPANYFQALDELNKAELDFDKIAEIIKQDLGLSYKLLRLINSAAFGVREEEASIKQALVLLGIEEVKKWIDLLVVKEIGEGKPKEVMRTTLIRAKLAELLGEKMAADINTAKLFMMGLFSLLDVLLERNLEELLRELPISIEIKSALLGFKGRFRDVYELTLAYEEGNWEQVAQYKKIKSRGRSN